MRLSCVRVISVVAIVALVQALLLPNVAFAGEAETRAKCAAAAANPAPARAAGAGAATVTTYSATRARVSGYRPAVRVPVRGHAPHFHVGGGIAGILIGVAVGVAISAIAEEHARSEAEKSCLLAHGIIKPSKPKAPHSREGSDGIRRGISVAPTSHCACPQMKTCSGSWATMSCKRLVDLCQNPRDSIQYMKNGCDRLKQLVGF